MIKSVELQLDSKVTNNQALEYIQEQVPMEPGLNGQGWTVRERRPEGKNLDTFIFDWFSTDHVPTE